MVTLKKFIFPNEARQIEIGQNRKKGKPKST